MATPIRETSPGFGLYVHWPFCLSLCPYCDFNSYLARDVDHARWRDALLAELDHFAARTGRCALTSIFFGGGTPSLMAPETIGAVIARARERFDLAADAEITMEANPTSVEAGRLAACRDAGINRVSLGVQSLDPDALAFLGRKHSAAEAIAAVETARGLFDRVSLDLIYARPGQTAKDWRAELERALQLAGGHISVYQLTIEEGTPFHTQHARGDFRLPAERGAVALWQATQDVLGAAGLPAYEISNHARPGEACRHNLTYWRLGDWIGIGPGAHGRLTLDGTLLATRQTAVPAAWLAAVEKDGHATREETVIGRDEIRDELVTMGLRLTDGIARDRFRARLGAEPEDALDASRLGRLVAGGFVVLDAVGLRATPAGLRRLDAVLGALVG
ncbi:MAG: radical SAM family heme chaperone HemW [Alphaproteobacteria bacterium]